jgi:16S rRNA processing protein RimM
MAGPGPPAMVCVAQVATAHGVRGALRLRTFTEAPENVAAYGPLFDEEGRELFSVSVIGAAKGGVLVRAEGVDTRDAAEALRGMRLYVPRGRLPEPEDEDEFYLSDLAGLEAVDPEGTPRGRVVAVQNFGAGDLVEVRGPDGETFYVPFTRELVPEVDVKGGRVVIAPAKVG